MSTSKILRKHILDAAKILDDNPDYNGFKEGTKYEVLINGKSYPPKQLAACALEIAGNGKHYPPDMSGFNKGKWHKLFRELGFPPAPKLKPSKNSISAYLGSGDDGLDEGKQYPEGEEYYVQHKKYERDSNVPKDAKKQRLREKGVLACDVCEFDFSKIYGEHGIGYIEAHHTIPVSLMKKRGLKTVITDIALVCANCHRMLHRKNQTPGANPFMDVKTLKELLLNP